MYWKVPMIVFCSVTGELLATSVSVTAVDGSDGGFGEAEVEKLGGGLGEHDVAGFEVAMHDAGAVGFIEGVSDFGADFESLIDRKRAPGDALGEALAFDAFHDKEIDAVLRADIEKRADYSDDSARRRSWLRARTGACARGRRKDVPGEL
jgi:hypothetical protein